ncbi:PLC-like phosphodiesterase [Panaeolus papilionaceus]|nr:PLC-like phosphodiesterase [Panaeolus papilionaceus]
MKLLFETLVLVLLIQWVSGWTIPFTKRATICNGHAELCGRRFSNITYIGAHDSFAYSVDPLALGRDQEVDIPTQLNLGVRLLQAQSHIQASYTFVTLFIFDGGNVTSYLRTVKTWLDANPNEVITFIFTNPENVSLQDFWRPAFDDSGISSIAYVPPAPPVKQSDWPTLGSLIDSGKRVVVFMDAGADTAIIPYILPEFQMIWETPFSVTDPTFPCRVDRIHGPLSVEDHTYMINHSLNINILPSGGDVIIPDRMNAQITNGMASILSHIQNCAPLGASRNPQFILMDWVHIGDGFRVADMLNGVP